MGTLLTNGAANNPWRLSQRKGVRGWFPRTLRKLLLSAPVVAALTGSGCQLEQWVHNGFKVGPNYSRPAAPVASEWIDYRDARVKSEKKDLSEWWRVFNDPALDSLMEAAYQQNISLRVAGARILVAQAQRGIAVGNLFPQVQQGSGSLTWNKLPGTIANPFPDQWFKNETLGLNASWELDFWGRFRRSIEAADAELDSSIENYDDVLVILLADVATSYTDLRTFQERLRYAWQNVAAQYNAYNLASDKYILGAATERDVQQAKQILEQTRARIPQLEAGIRTANNQLCILLGMPPRELSELDVGTFEASLRPLKELVESRVSKLEKMVDKYTKDKMKPAEEMPGLIDQQKDPKLADLLKPLQPRQLIPVAPPEVVVGIPADLLRRRPDVRRDERQVAAQSARIGIAVADFYPQLFINGTIGVASEQFNNLFRCPASMLGSVGPSFQWNILNYGRILNNVRAQDARFQELAFFYQNSVLKAGREVEESIIGFLKAQEGTVRLGASVAAASRTVDISFDQYRLGAIDFTPVVLFESTLADQQDQYAVSQGNIALSLISTYRALGGGWEMRLTRGGNGDCLRTTMTTSSGQPMPEVSETTQVNSLPAPGADAAPSRKVSFKISSLSNERVHATPTTAPVTLDGPVLLDGSSEFGTGRTP
jgi:outer membrane protein TolC